MSIYKHQSGMLRTNVLDTGNGSFMVRQRSLFTKDDCIVIRWQDWPALRDAVEREYARRTQTQENKDEGTSHGTAVR